MLDWTTRLVGAVVLATGLAVATVPAAHAQTAAPLTLREAVVRAVEDGPGAEVARAGYEQARWDFRAFRAEYRPSLTLNGDAPGLQRSISDILQDDGSVRYIEQERLFSSASMSLNQPLPLTGGRVFVSSGLSHVQQYGAFDVSEWQSSPLIVGLVQPLFRFNNMKWDRRVEPVRFDVERQTYLEDLQQVAVDVADAFFDVYLAQMNVDIADFNVAVNDTIYTLSRGRYDIGTIAENDLLQSELALLNAQTALAQARIDREEAAQRLKLLLGMDYDAPVEIVPPVATLDVDIDPETAVRQARQNRSAFLGLQVEELEAARAVAEARSERGFAADLTASYGLNQTAPALGDAYRSPLNQQRLSVGFSMPVFQWGQGKARVEAARAAQKQTARRVQLRRDELEQEVYFEALRVRQLQQQARLAAKADTVAARRFEVARNRYDVGKVDITELFNAQREKDGARRSFVQTLRQYWTSYYRLRRLTLYDFGTARPVQGP